MDKDIIKKKIISEIEKTKSKVEQYRDMSTPISPDNSIGRVSRMDAINNKGVTEYALRRAEERLNKLTAILSHIDDENYGVCKRCGKVIAIERLMYLPESVFCVHCTKK